MSREQQIIDERLRKLRELKEAGINPYPHKFDKKHSTKDSLNSKLGTKVKTAGRLMTKRDIGKIAFARLQDQEGQIQIVLQKGETPEKSFEIFKKYTDTGDFIGVAGKVFKTKTGETSILVESLEILTKSILPLPEKFHGLQDKEERYRKRYLDLIMNPEVREVFVKKQKVIDTIREFLVERGYLEVQTPILQPIYGGASAAPFISKLNALDMKVYMRISNELYLKRLIAGGFEKVFEFSTDFRNEGIDRSHNPEFVLFEAMTAYADYKEGMKIIEELTEYVVKKINGSTKIKYQGKTIDFKTPWKKMTMIESINKLGKLDVEKMTEKELEEKLEELQINLPTFNRGTAIEAIFGELVEPHLIQPTIIYDYPFETCGLAKPNEKNPKYTERFEQYVNGWELGNNYSELNNPEILENYWNKQEKLLCIDEEAQRMDKDFLSALQVGMPPTCGIAIGVERLVMLLTDQPSIRDVILFPFMKPLEAEKKSKKKK